VPYSSEPMAPVTTILAHLLAAGLLASVPPAARAASPAPQLQQLLAAERLSAAAVSFVVIDAQSGQPVFGQNVDTPRSPASTIKLLTTFAGLDLLGPAYVWRTRALIRGELANGELDGDLILQGGGDPYMTLERWWSFARRLRATGLKTIRGGIVVDNQAFSLKSIDPGAFDGRPHRAYNAVPDALMVNFQSIEFNLAHVTFTGALSGRCEPRGFTRVLLNPAEYAYGTFLSLWRELGGSADGGLRIEAAAADARVLLSFDSLPLGEIVRLTNKYSSNVMARHLLLTVGAERFGFPATVEKGIAAIDEWAGSLGLPMDGVEIDNGSGLSRGARVSVAAMGRLLVAAYHSRYAPEFLASLPLAGMDGTLRSRLTGTPGGAVRLKTGHLDGVSGVAGYVAVPGGRTYVLVSLINDPEVDSGAGDAVHATLVKWLLENP